MKKEKDKRRLSENQMYQNGTRTNSFTSTYLLIATAVAHDTQNLMPKKKLS